jgi:hypothetical protein
VYFVLEVLTGSKK